MSSSTNKVELKRVNFNIPVSLYNDVQKFAVKNNYTLTMAFQVLLQDALHQNVAFEKLPELIEIVLNAKEIDNKKQSKKINK